MKTSLTFLSKKQKIAEFFWQRKTSSLGSQLSLLNFPFCAHPKVTLPLMAKIVFRMWRNFVKLAKISCFELLCRLVQFPERKENLVQNRLEIPAMQIRILGFLESCLPRHKTSKLTPELNFELFRSKNFHVSSEIQHSHTLYWRPSEMN